MVDPEYQDGEPPTPQDASDGVIISPDTLREDRVPPGQARTRRYPVLDAFGPPQISLETWRLEVTGLALRPQSWDGKEFRSLPSVRVFSDFHCVTRWSRLGNTWEGVATRWIADRAGVQDEARFVVLHAFDNNWTTNLPIEHFLAGKAQSGSRQSSLCAKITPGSGNGVDITCLAIRGANSALDGID